MDALALVHREHALTVPITNVRNEIGATSDGRGTKADMIGTMH